EGEHARLLVGDANLHRAAAQARIGGAYARHLRQAAVHVGVRVIGTHGRADASVVGVGGDVRLEHVLTRVAVVAVAGEALFVAVVDHRHAAPEKDEGVGEGRAVQQLRIGDV